jgi:hypothetical protein
MAGRERVASAVRPVHGSTAGRVIRGVIGIALIVAGLLVGGVGGWVLGASGSSCWRPGCSTSASSPG